MSLKGKTALVTGSTSGIGLAIARALALAGADLVLNGFGDAAQIEALVAEIQAEAGVKVVYDGADMSKPATVPACPSADMPGALHAPPQQPPWAV